MAKKKRAKKTPDWSYAVRYNEEDSSWEASAYAQELEALFEPAPGSNIVIDPPEPAEEFHHVNKPAHYVQGREYEPIDVLMDWFSADPLLWQVGKYISRAGRKGDAIEDLEKAKWYLEKKIQLLKSKA